MTETIKKVTNMNDYNYEKIMHILAEIQYPEMMEKCIQLLEKNKEKFQSAPASRTYFAKEGGFSEYTLLCLQNGKRLHDALRPEAVELPHLLVGLVFHHIDSMNRYLWKDGKVVEVVDLPCREFMIGYILGRRSVDFFPNLFSSAVEYKGPIGKLIQITSDFVIANEKK